MIMNNNVKIYFEIQECNIGVEIQKNTLKKFG